MIDGKCNALCPGHTQCELAVPNIKLSEGSNDNLDHIAASYQVTELSSTVYSQLPSRMTEKSHEIC